MKHPSQFKVDRVEQNQESDIKPDWFRICEMNEHLTDFYIDNEDQMIHFECASCNKSETK